MPTQREILFVKDTSSAILDLQSRCESLHDLDRAQAVHVIHRSGTSLSQLAKALKLSPSLLRHVLESLEAPKADQLLARNGKLTTNQLVRCAKAAKISQEAKKAEAQALERTQSSIRGCEAICDWIAAEQNNGAAGEQIIKEASWFLYVAENTNKLPRDAAPPGTPTAEIIKRCRPPEQKNDEVSYVVWFGHWLALWAAYSMTDSWVRYKAIELALEKQLRRR